VTTRPSPPRPSTALTDLPAMRTPPALRHALRTPLYALLALALSALALTPAPARAAEGGTLDIVGHVADGFYLDFEPMGLIELPRFFLMTDAEGGYSFAAYGSTAAALRSGDFELHLEGHGEEDGEHGEHGEDGAHVVSPGLELEEAIEAHEHLHASIVPVAGTVALDFSITRHLVFGLLAMALVMLTFIPLAGRYKAGVGRETAPRGAFHNMMEAMVIYIRDEVAKPTIGEKHEKFLPFLLTAFFFILFANLLGLVPYGAAATSNIAVTGALAFFTFIIGQVYASKEHWKHLFMGPEGIPGFVRPIIVPVEVLGLFTRHFALAIRLFANMMAGSLVIFSLLGLIFFLNVLFGAGAAYGGALPSIGLTVFILMVKLLVAFVQAFVFTMLSALFIGMSVEEHHHEEGHTPEGPHHDPGKVTPHVAGDGMVEERTRVQAPVPAS
jgi:F-type H+-transporting ATPase subunit a